ncbi:MAG: DUF1592 domain-containing protein [Archangiaceae bacterium]|nr:DUF1592 domain-containing protein [Archangiaceae bacterium]
MFARTLVFGIVTALIGAGCTGLIDVPGSGGSPHPAGAGGGTGTGGGTGAGGAGGGDPTPWMPPAGPYTCTPADFTGITLNQLQVDYATNVHPLLKSSCMGCHGETSNRLFLVTADAAATFVLDRATGMFRPGGNTLLGRLREKDPTLSMPRGSSWPQEKLDQVVRFTCELQAYEAAECATAAIDPGPSPLRRLTPLEYTNTVQALLGVTTRPGDAFPPESAAYGFDNNADVQTVDSLRAQKFIDAAEALGNTANLGSVTACAAQATITDACARDFISKLGAKAFRRPVTSEDLTLYGNFFTAAATNTVSPVTSTVALRMVLKAMLLSPHFLYRVEVGQAGSSGAAVQLTPYELATRLSYMFWQTAPDATLTQAASSGQLSTRAQVEAQARRLLADPKARPMVRAFHDQWLQLTWLKLATKDATRYPSFDTVQKPLLAQETQLFYEDVFWNGTVDQLLGADYTFVDSTLATFYGLPALTGTGFQKVQLGASVPRRGLLTQGAWLAGHAHPDETDPVVRGKFVREQLLCQELPPPPVGLVITPPVVSDTDTTRQRFEAHRQPACATCHALMDPVGFAFESFDTTGAWRSTENGLPIDSSSTVALTETADGTYAGAKPLVTVLAHSEQVTRCVATQWFRYTAGRGESAQDVCSLRRATERLVAAGGDARELLIALTQTDAFLYRRHP